MLHTLEISEKDPLIALIARIFREGIFNQDTNMLMLQSPDRVERFRNYLLTQPADLFRLSKDAEQLIGYCYLSVPKDPRRKHTASFHFALAEYAIKDNTETAYFVQMNRHAEEHGIRRIEVLITDDYPLVSKLEKFGFHQEGVKKGSILKDNMYKDEYLFVKTL